MAWGPDIAGKASAAGDCTAFGHGTFTLLIVVERFIWVNNFQQKGLKSVNFIDSTQECAKHDLCS